MRGRRPKSAALKALAGNPGKRKVSEAEAAMLPGTPEMPADLDETAAAEWNRLLPLLSDMRVIGAADGGALAGYCRTHSLQQQALAAISKFGALVEEPVKDKQGRILGHKLKSNPACRTFDACEKEMRAARGLFGLDPSSRTKVTPAPVPVKSILDRILDGDDDIDGIPERFN